MLEEEARMPYYESIVSTIFSRTDYLLTATKFAIFALALTGFVIYPNVLYPDVFTKGLYVRFFIAVAFAGALWLVAHNKIRITSPSLFGWATIVFLGSAVLSMFFSSSIFRSFWGEAQRMEGVFALLHYGALFFIARAVFTKNDWRMWCRTLTLTTLPLIAYAVLQYVEASQGVSIPFVVNANVHPGSLFGNPAFFSLFLIFAMGFAFFAYALETQKAWKRFALIAILASGTTILWLGIRGEVIGVAVGVVVGYGLYALWAYGKRGRLRFFTALAILFVLAGGVFALRGSLSEYYPRLVERIVNFPDEPSFKTRELSVRSSIQAWIHSPTSFLMGWGPEHFGDGYNLYYNPEHGTYEDVWFDRAHVKLADVVVTQGLIGLLAYFCLFGVLGWYVIRIKRAGHVALAAGVGGLLAAYFTQNLAFFDLPHSYVYFFLFAAFMETHTYGNAVYREVRERARTEKLEFSRVMLAVLVSAGLLVLVAYTVIVPLQQSARYISYFKTHEGDELVSEWNTIFRPRNFAHYTLVDDIWRRLQAQQAFRNPQFASVTALVIEEFEAIVARDPMDASMFLRLATVYTERAIGSDSKDDYAQGEAFARRAIELSPGRQENYYILSFNLQGQGRGDEAVRLMREAVALNPKTQKARYTLAANLALAGELEDAVREIERVHEGGWFQNFQESDAANIEKIYTAAGRTDLLLGVYESVLESGLSRNQEYFIALLRHYISMEDASKVIRWTIIYEDAYPDFGNDMNIVRTLVEEEKWEDLKKL